VTNIAATLIPRQLDLGIEAPSDERASNDESEGASYDLKKRKRNVTLGPDIDSTMHVEDMRYHGNELGSILVVGHCYVT